MSSSESRQDSSDPPNAMSGESLTIPVLREEVSVGVETVDAGTGVRIRKTVHEEPRVVEEVTHRDEVDVRRVPVDRIVASGEAPQSRYEGNTLIIPVLEEVLVVEKKLRIKEEIHITKTTYEEHKSEVVHVKSEDVSIERFDERNARKSDGNVAGHINPGKP